jgi:hypothetical protein
MGRQRPFRFSLPLGVADPYFMCELAEQLGMTLDDLGRRASNYEVCVTWPAFRAERARLQRIEQEKQQKQRGFG